MKSNIWIKWYKVLIYISAVIILLVGLAFGVDEAYDFGELLIYVIPFALLAGLDLVVGMLIVTFFENVQVIRDKVEELSAESITKYNSNVVISSNKQKPVNTTNANVIKPTPVMKAPSTDEGYVDIQCPNCASKISVPNGASNWFCPHCDFDITIE